MSSLKRNVPAGVDQNEVRSPKEGSDVEPERMGREQQALAEGKTAKNPEPTPPTDKIDSEAAAFARGTYDELRDQWSFAWHDYAAGLKKFPGSVKLGLAAGRAAFVLGRYDDAIHILGGMADTNTEAGYYFAMALIGTSQRLPDARDALIRASKDPLYGAAARLQSALCRSRIRVSGTAPDALRALQALASVSGAPAGIGALEVANVRRTGQADEARRRLDFWLKQDPAIPLVPQLISHQQPRCSGPADRWCRPTTGRNRSGRSASSPGSRRNRSRPAPRSAYARLARTRRRGCRRAQACSTGRQHRADHALLVRRPELVTTQMKRPAGDEKVMSAASIAVASAELAKLHSLALLRSKPR